MFVCVAVGLWGGLLIGLVTEYYTSNRYRPVQVSGGREGGKEAVGRAHSEAQTGAWAEAAAAASHARLG